MIQVYLLFAIEFLLFFSFVWLIDLVDLIICLVFSSFAVSFFLFLTAPFRDHLCDILSLLAHDDGQKNRTPVFKMGTHTNSKLDFQL